MDIFDSVLGREIKAIIYDKDKPVIYRWLVQIYANNKTFNVIKVLNMDYEENPEQNYCARVMTRVAIEAGTYFYQILPYDNNLEISVTRYVVSQTTDDINYQEAPRVERYTATIVNKEDYPSAGNLPDNVSESLLNVSDVVQIEFQLINKAIDQLRSTTIGGVVRKTDVKTLLQTSITSAFGSLNVDTERKPLGVDITAPSNQATQEHFVLPHGLKLVDLPDYLQNHSGGVYSSGLGHFIKDEFWYIYPKYDVERFGSTQRVMTVIRVPPNKIPGSEKTYRINGGNLIVLATDEAQKNNISEIHQQNEGGGTRFATADNFLESFTQTQDNRTLARRGARASEFVGQQRPNGLNNVLMSKERITSNGFKQYSDIAKRQGNLFTFVWENSNMDLVLPGMLVKVLMLEGDDVIQLSGSLLGSYHAIQQQGQGAFIRDYSSKTILHVFVKTQTEGPVSA